MLGSIQRPHPPEPATGEHLRKVTAIVRTSVLARVEERLRRLFVPGISVTKVKGYGEYANFFDPAWVCEHARIEIYCRRERVDEIASGITRAAHTGAPGDGIVVVVPVESIYRVRTGSHATTADLGGCECVSETGKDMPDQSGGADS